MKVGLGHFTLTVQKDNSENMFTHQLKRQIRIDLHGSDYAYNHYARSPWQHTSEYLR